MNVKWKVYPIHILNRYIPACKCIHCFVSFPGKHRGWNSLIHRKAAEELMNKSKSDGLKIKTSSWTESFNFSNELTYLTAMPWKAQIANTSEMVFRSQTQTVVVEVRRNTRDCCEMVAVRIPMPWWVLLPKPISMFDNDIGPVNEVLMLLNGWFISW